MIASTTLHANCSSGNVHGARLGSPVVAFYMVSALDHFLFQLFAGCALPDVACGHRLSGSACILLRRFASRDDIGWIAKEV